MLDQLVSMEEKEEVSEMSCTLYVVSSRLGTSIGRLGMSLQSILMTETVLSFDEDTMMCLRPGFTEFVCLWL